MDFNGRHVVVTGGTGALGLGVVTALVEAGGICHIPYTRESAAAEFPLRDHARVVLYGEADLTDAESVEQLYDRLPPLWASIHLAGGFAYGPLRDLEEDVLHQQIAVNLLTCALCCRQALRSFTRGRNGGRIVNVAARPALEWRTGAGMAIYAAAKAAVAALTVALAEEVAKEGVLVNAVAPSIMDTPANRKDMPKADLSAWPKVEEVASTILFLASPENRVTRGAIVPVYGKA
ncbi:SDR family NAD(P)-dependent oxidoreductase [Rhodoplanes roseus]|uniref:Short-chain dehydrogenase n=1 Tax=Rhodoplanes roseus TaxID=29409 RepID=A0A327KWX5_9BRAD|nr:SDR family NAD(P)-dependent oxidoreductase [Rhodoplanes roseus]RAI42596.1 short-chain dehydrogenase [Rhodoplanes roseus]